MSEERVICVAGLDGYSRRKDGSLTLRFATAEQTSAFVHSVDQLYGEYGILYFRASNVIPDDDLKQLDDHDIDIFDQPKTQSQRLRAVLYKCWVNDGSSGKFDAYYRQQTERIIEHYKAKLD